MELASPAFIRNLSDELHCHQACILMVLRQLQPEKNWTFEIIDEMTGFVSGKMTWPMKSYLALCEIGVDVRVIEPFDYRTFVREPFEYLVREAGADSAKYIAENSDLDVAVTDAQRLLESTRISLEHRLPEVSDLSALLSKGYYEIAHVNQRMLQGDEGYIGHSLLVYGLTEKAVIGHNPGPPATEASTIPIELFVRAWSSPSDAARSLLAISGK